MSTLDYFLSLLLPDPFEREALIIISRLFERILCRIGQALWLVVSHILNAHVLQEVEEMLAYMREGDGTVVRIVLLDEHVTIEAAHLRNSEDTDATEGACRHVEHLALSDVGAEHTLGVALHAVECDLARSNVALQCATCEVRLATVLQQTVLDELVLDGTSGAHLAGWCVAAVEAHEGVGELVVVLADDVLIVDILGYRVVDVEQGDGVVAQAHADVLRERTVDVHLAGHGDATAHQTGVDIAGLETELAWEGRPALVGEGHILAGALVLLSPVEQCQLKLRHAAAEVGIVLALAHLGSHILADVVDTRVVLVLLVSHEEVELRVLLNLHTEFIESLDRSVAGEEVLRTRTEGDDLQTLQADDGTGHGHEVSDHLGDVVGGAYRISGDIALEVTHGEVVAAVEHTAIGVATAVDHVAVALSGRDEHARAMELLGDERLGGLRTEVAKEHDEGVAASLAHLFDGLEHILLILYCSLAVIYLALISFHDVLATLGGKSDRETVTADGDDTELHLGNVVALHNLFV